MFTNGLQPPHTMHPPVSIDASLARFVRRAYSKRLTDEWGESGKLLKKAQQRNLKRFCPSKHKRQSRPCLISAIV